MAYHLDLQTAIVYPNIPSKAQFQQWVDATLILFMPEAELTIRIVGEEESAQLNETYRHRKGATNILSFPFENEGELDIPLLGDMIICAPLVSTQAKEQEKSVEEHWAHLVVHGTLHLLGYDHEQEQDAEVMESFEIKILQELGYPNPYGEIETL